MGLKDIPKRKAYESNDEIWSSGRAPEGYQGDSEKEQEDKVREVSLDLLKPFPEHHFQLYQGKRKEEMEASIREFGILQPLILWKQKEDSTYTILAGHNRAKGAEALQLPTVPAVIKENLTLEEATLIVTETNLRQRAFSEMSYKERAFSLAQHYNACKSQGKRNDLLAFMDTFLGEGEDSGADKEQKDSTPTKSLSARERLGQESQLSPTTIGRYVRLVSLPDPFFQALEQEKIPFFGAYELTFLEESAHPILISYLEEGNCLTIAQCKALRLAGAETGVEGFSQILYSSQGEKEEQKEQRKEEKRQLKKSMKACETLWEQAFSPQYYGDLPSILEEALVLYQGKYPQTKKE